MHLEKLPRMGRAFSHVVGSLLVGRKTHGLEPASIVVLAESLAVSRSVGDICPRNAMARYAIEPSCDRKPCLSRG
jgi:hypothetical protein